MKENAYFLKGARHDICEDYCVSGNTGEWHYVIGSDGCSSSHGSDFGSRLLCHGARSAIEETDRSIFAEGRVKEAEKILREKIILKMAEVKTSFNLKRTALDATLLLVLANNNRRLFFMWGDGIIAIRRKSGLEIIDIEYTTGAPSYLSYEINHADTENYHLQFGDCPPLLHRQFFRDINNCSETAAINDRYYCGEISDEMDNPLISISIFSDGLHSFTEESGAAAITGDMAKIYTSFPHTAGDFVIRRMKKLRRHQKRMGITHYDDLFCGSIIFNTMEAPHEDIH